MRIPSRRTTSVAGLHSVRAVALLGALVLVFGACGNESSKSDLKALLGNNNNPSASQPQAPAAGAPAVDNGTGASAVDNGSAAGTPAPAATPGAPAAPAAA